MKQINSTKSSSTCNINIYIIGDINWISQLIQKFAIIGLCVTITSTKYIYSGGNEDGVIIGLINYAKYSKSNIELVDRAFELATYIMIETHQRSCSIVTPELTHWLENPDYKTLDK